MMAGGDDGIQEVNIGLSLSFPSLSYTHTLSLISDLSQCSDGEDMGILSQLLVPQPLSGELP